MSLGPGPSGSSGIIAATATAEPPAHFWARVTARGRWVAGGRTAPAAVVQTVLTKGFLLVVNLATGIIVARGLAPVGRGEQAAISVWPTTLSFLFLISLPVSLVYNVRRFPEDRRELASSALILVAIFGLAATVAGEFIVPLFLTKYPPEIVAFARSLLLFTPPLMVLLLFQALLEVRNDFSTSNLIRYLPPLVTLGALGALALRHTLTPYSASIAYAVPPALMTLFIGWHLRAQFTLEHRGFVTAAKRLLRYGGQSYPIDLIGQFSMQTAQLLVVSGLRPAELGIYTVALNVSRIVNLVHSSLNIVLFPKASALSVQAIVDLTGCVARISTGLTVGLGVLFIAVIPVLLPLLYGRDFRSAVLVAWILIVEVIISGLTSVLAQAFMATGKPGAVAVMQGGGTLFAIPLMLVLIPRYGIAGAACAQLMSTCTRFVLAMTSFPLLLQTPPPGLLLMPSDIRYLRERFAVVH